MKSRRPLTVGICAGAAVLITGLIASFASSSTLLSRGATAGAGIAARLGDHEITLADVDARWQHENPAEYGEAMDALYEGRKRALQRVVADIVLNKAAASRGMTREQLIDVEMVRRVEPVGERDVMAFYAANVDRLGAGGLDQHRARIEEVLERRARDRAYAHLVTELAQRSSATGVFLEPVRQPVPLADTDPGLGERGAPVTIVVFSDFQCPFCARVEPTLKDLRDTYGDKVRIVWKDFPLTTIHPEAFKSAEASHCAAEQGRYLEYHDRLFAHQDRLSADSLYSLAGLLGLDTQSFAGCLSSSRYAARVQASLDAGRKVGVQSTPTLFVNGRAVRGAQPFEVFADIIDEELVRVGR